jgi:hypothetical protein
VNKVQHEKRSLCVRSSRAAFSEQLMGRGRTGDSSSGLEGESKTGKSGNERR